MDRAMLIGLPATLIGAVAGILLMARGATVFGAILVGVSILATMVLVGQGMPRPDVVARPGEEQEYEPEPQ
jgi:hypothetical protein